MNIHRFQAVNAERGQRWHQGNLNQWTPLEWATAMAGEAGEAANVAKKIRRIDLELPNKEAGLSNADLAALREKLANECADVIIYGLLTLSVIDFNLTQVHTFSDAPMIDDAQIAIFHSELGGAHLKNWSLLELTGVLIASAGAACQEAHGLKVQSWRAASMKAQIARHVITTIKQALIILATLDVRASEIIARVFDKKSIEYGFPERAES